MIVMSLIGQLACVAPLLGGRLIIVVSHFSFAHHFLSELTEYYGLYFFLSYLDRSITFPYPTHTYLRMQEPFPPSPFTLSLHPLASQVLPFPQTATVIENNQGLCISVCIPHMYTRTFYDARCPQFRSTNGKIRLWK